MGLGDCVMRVLQINTVNGTGSTGRIVVDLYKALENKGHSCFIAYGRGESPEGINSYKISTSPDTHIHALKTRITDKTGFYSAYATSRFLGKIDAFDPDIIHLHNLHGYYINIEILFDYLRHIKKPVVWTLHDCWAFTGHCAYFDYVKCEKWKTGCYSCPQKKNYPKSILLDNSKWNYKQKRQLFTSVENMTIVTPSSWLAGLVKESFLGKYDVRVINNGIDLDIFKPSVNDYRKKHELKDIFIILGVANIWDKRKGLDDFIKLSRLLEDTYKIVLVGLSEKQLKTIPENIIGIEKTNNITKLAEIYSIADVYVNAGVEETMGLTTVEALACGIPVVVYDATAIPECVDESVGFIVEKNNIQALAEAIKLTKNMNPFNKNSCITKAKSYNKQNKYKEYLDLYTCLYKM